MITIAAPSQSNILYAGNYIHVHTNLSSRWTFLVGIVTACIHECGKASSESGLMTDPADVRLAGKSGGGFLAILICAELQSSR